MEIKQIQQRHEAACQVVNELCSGDRKWLMSIPARPEYDPDLLISASLNDIPALLEEIKKLEKELWDMRIDVLITKVLPLAAELKDKWVRGVGAKGSMPCPVCGNYIDWGVSGHGNRHTHGKCRGCWVAWQE